MGDSLKDGDDSKIIPSTVEHDKVQIMHNKLCATKQLYGAESRPSVTQMKKFEAAYLS